MPPDCIRLIPKQHTNRFYLRRQSHWTESNGAGRRRRPGDAGEPGQYPFSGLPSPAIRQVEYPVILLAELAFFCLFSAVITYGLGIFVYAKNPASAVNRLFLAAMLAAAYWATGEFMIWQSAGFEAVNFWLRASAFWPLAIAFCFHFILAFTHHRASWRQNRLWIFLFLYIPASVFSLLGIVTDLIYTVRFHPDIGYIYVPVSESLVYQATTAFMVIVMALAISIGLASWLRTPDANLRKQYFLVTISIVIVVICGSLSGLILPSSGIFLPNLVFIGMILFSFIIAYAIMKYRLFTLSPETAVSEILRTMPDGFILADMDDRIVTANASAAATAGADPLLLAGQAVATVIPDRFYRTLKASVLAQGTITEFEADLEGERRMVVSIAGSLVKDPAGKAAGIVLIIHDITRRKEQEKALRQASGNLSLLNQVTRHDISNLVTALSSYLTLLSQKPGTDLAAGQYISSSLDLVEKISDHLRFSREYQEIGVLEPAWQSLNAMIDRAVKNVPSSGVIITAQADPVEIYADPLVHKVIYNVLENAVRHGGHVTSIRVSSAQQANGVLSLVIQDDGVGVREEEKERIFERGYGKNTGLGLTLSRQILAVTGMTIAENGQSGSGARFEIRIPASAWRPVSRTGETGSSPS